MAFPTTGLLDNFNRATEDPLGNGTWSGPIRATNGQMKVGSGGSANAITRSAGTPGQSYWSVATFGPDSEVYATISTVPGNGDYVYLYARIVNPNTAGLDGYAMVMIKQAGDDIWQIRRIDDSAETVLGANATQELASGESMGFEIIGSTLTAYRKSAGVWSSVLSRTDATYSAAGYIGIGSATTVAIEDDFSGGTVVAAGAAAKPGHGALLSGFRNQVIQRV
ncbi:MAG: hypothetical protein U1C74_25920 [Phenylobacterium sp.]|nr:hypothetical protein [Candidatus Omnitrophota bacterium]MDZ4374832.1 hypothetical protein [Phenylobacterium sp.]